MNDEIHTSYCCHQRSNPKIKYKQSQENMSSYNASALGTKILALETCADMCKDANRFCDLELRVQPYVLFYNNVFGFWILILNLHGKISSCPEIIWTHFFWGPTLAMFIMIDGWVRRTRYQNAFTFIWFHIWSLSYHRLRAFKLKW